MNPVRVQVTIQRGGNVSMQTMRFASKEAALIARMCMDGVVDWRPMPYLKCDAIPCIPRVQ